MAKITLTPTKTPTLRLEAENICPDSFAGKSNEEIANLHVFVGKESQALGDYFEIAGESGSTAAETTIVINGDVNRVKYIGMKMSAGEVIINGDADMYVGAWMSGGKINANGSVDAFSGLGMTGGELIIKGDAGNYLGAAYRGDWRGMQGGTIRVSGNAGSDVGTFMRGGTIIIGGNVDVHVGTHMEGGTIIVKGDAKSRVGGQMVKGDIYVFGDIEVMMPGFQYRKDVDSEVDGTTGSFALYEGDIGERHGKSKGETIYGKLYMKH
ncbi:MAG TPA: formylmethanofuran dehydrogenase subunit C [Methanoculleus sp.]|nr:formylmethanofuran dehydrogenase subunit C [Methanoculleus sp.]